MNQSQRTTNSIIIIIIVKMFVLHVSLDAVLLKIIIDIPSEANFILKNWQLKNIDAYKVLFKKGKQFKNVLYITITTTHISLFK